MTKESPASLARYDPTQGVQYVTVSQVEAGQRIDNFLLRLIDRVPKSVIYKKLRKGEVRINKKRAKPTQKVQPGDVVRIPPIHVDAAEDHPASRLPPKLLAEVTSWIHFEDKDMLVLDKPAGIAVHSGSGVDYGVIDLLRAERYHGQYLELAHRLDRDTSGLLVLAKNASMLREIQTSMRALDSVKRYHCWVHGDWSPSREVITLPLQRVQRGRERMVEVATNEAVEQGEAKTAETRFQLRETQELGGHTLSLLEATLITGRTHQIRVHAQSQQHPIVFDRKYGDRVLDKLVSDSFTGRALQLRAVELMLYLFGERRQFTVSGLSSAIL